MDIAPVLINGTWRAAKSSGSFHAENPATGKTLSNAFPVSVWSDCDAALAAASKAATILRTLNEECLADFLDVYARNIESAAEAIIQAASEETGLPVAPRLKDVELPRTTNQLRQAAAAAREGSWRRATLDIERNIRSCFAPIGPVVIFGPNNFPLAFNSVSGGDFAAAIAGGNPVIAKAHPLHPNTTRLLAEEARKAVEEVGLPAGTVQMIYHTSNEDGLRLVSDPRVGAIGFTGSRAAAMALKRAAEDAGKPIYLEMSSINPVIFLPGAVSERADELALELADSCLAGAGQFCTSPNLILALDGLHTERMIQGVAKIFSERPSQPLLSASGREHLHHAIALLRDAGSQLVTGGKVVDGPGYRHDNTLLRVSAKKFMASPKDLQREAFGNATLFVITMDSEELVDVVRLLEGNLTGSIYSAKSTGEDDELYARVETLLREKTGRLLNDKMPTGVAVSPAMHHGGPYPATGHPGFSSVGIPYAMTRFAVLQCYDGVRQERLPELLKDQIHNPDMWRCVNGSWIKGPS